MIARCEFNCFGKADHLSDVVVCLQEDEACRAQGGSKNCEVRLNTANHRLRFRARGVTGSTGCLGRGLPLQGRVRKISSC